jgi:hypothetical protein
MCRVIQSCATGVDLILQARDRRPQQRHRAGNVRSGHRRAAGKRICVIPGVVTGPCVRARSGDIRFYPITPIDCHRAAATKPGDVIGAGS